MKKLVFILSLVLGIALVSCSPSPDKVIKKIESKQELTQEDYQVITDYISEMMADGTLVFQGSEKLRLRRNIHICKSLAMHSTIRKTRNIILRSISFSKGK